MMIRTKSVREGNMVGLKLVYPDDSTRLVAMAEMPDDRDWRADITFYDGLVELYKKRLKAAMRNT